METTKIKGYNYADVKLEKSPVTIQELELLKKTLLWSKDDDRYLKMAGEVLREQVEDVLDLWYSFVAGNEHLVYYFSKDGKPDGNYLEAVRARFGQWIIDLCERPYDQNWLNYQHEIALRHHSSKKNRQTWQMLRRLLISVMLRHSFIPLQQLSNHFLPIMIIRRLT